PAPDPGGNSSQRARPKSVVIFGGIVSGAAAILAVFLPKCPLCVAALLAAVGVGAGAASLAAPHLRLATLSVAVITICVVLGRSSRRVLKSRTAAEESCKCGCQIAREEPH